MNTIIRNLLSVVRRFKLAAILNLLGLSVAFAAFMVIMIQLDYDLNFGKCHKDYDKIFRVELIRNKEKIQPVLCRPIIEQFIESSPQIVAGGFTTTPELETFFYVENQGNRNYYKENYLKVSPDIFNVFSFDFVEGSPDALKTPDNAVIPLSMARKLFGKESPVGKQLIDEQRNLIVGAVYRDLPKNTFFNNCIYLAIPPDENIQGFGNFSYYTYIRVDETKNAQIVCENYNRNYDAQSFNDPYNRLEGIELRLSALPTVHFMTDLLFDAAPKASKQAMLILLSIAVVIVVIAGINFTNFSTALTPMRVKSINTQRVLGARQRTIRLSLIFEAVSLGGLSFMVAILLFLLFTNSPVANLADADLSLADHPLIIGGTALVALLIGLIVGVYPSRYMTSFAPALVLKGSFGLSPKGKKLRNTLIGVQYFASFALIIGASFMFLQNRFMQSSLGFDKDALLTVDISKIREKRDAFTNQLKMYSGIEEVGYSQALLANPLNRYMGWEDEYQGQKTEMINMLPVTYSFLKTMGIEVTEGRDFRQEDTNLGGEGVFVFNETAHKEYNMEIGTTIRGGVIIIGFIPDLHFASFRRTIAPMAFCVGSFYDPYCNHAYIRVKAGANKYEAMKYIQSTLAEFDADYPFNVRFFDEVLQRLYEKETALSSLISLFSIIAIFISIVGVFGLVVFDSECRHKEIAIRKVLGASTRGIIIMFNKGYFRILMVCFVVAAPLAWYAVNRWLQNFAYKTPMYWWVYLLALAVVGIITAFTVTFQNWRVANDDPVKAIKSE